MPPEVSIQLRFVIVQLDARPGGPRRAVPLTEAGAKGLMKLSGGCGV